jgi:hypothetical protein
VDIPLSDRRAHVRYSGTVAGIAQATLRPGRGIRVVDVSRGGALVETDRPLRPGSPVHLRLDPLHRTAIVTTAVVLRCAVWTLVPEAGVVYRGALRFDESVPLSVAPAAADAVHAGSTGA